MAGLKQKSAAKETDLLAFFEILWVWRALVAVSVALAIFAGLYFDFKKPTLFVVKTSFSGLPAFVSTSQANIDFETSVMSRSEYESWKSGVTSPDTDYAIRNELSSLNFAFDTDVKRTAPFKIHNIRNVATLTFDGDEIDPETAHQYVMYIGKSLTQKYKVIAQSLMKDGLGYHPSLSETNTQKNGPKTGFEYLLELKAYVLFSDAGRSILTSKPAPSVQKVRPKLGLVLGMSAFLGLSFGIAGALLATAIVNGRSGL